MIRNITVNLRMPRPLLLTAVLLTLFIPFSHVIGQHADLGTGNLKDQIWWINWAGINFSNGTTQKITTDNGLTLNIAISNTSSRNPVPTIMNSWSGAVLHLLYDFSDPTILPSLYDNNQTGVVKFSLAITATRNGQPVPFYLVTGDAEGSWQGEATTFHTDGSPWQTMTLFRNSGQRTDPVAGCGTQTAIITETYAGASQTGQNPLITTLSQNTGTLNLDVTLDHATSFGGMAVAFGILQAEDRGDLPASYGFAQHEITYNIIDPCGYLPPNMPSLDQNAPLYIGSIPPDADGLQTLDDNANGVDEEGALNAFHSYDNSGTYSLTFDVVNHTGTNAFLSGWFDYNRDGAFSTTERTIITVPPNTTSVTLTWTGLPQYLPNANSSYAFRFRLSTDQSAISIPTGFAPDGEVEDYLVAPTILCRPITASIAPVSDICPGQSAPLHATGNVSYSWTPTTGLSDPNSADPIATPATTTTYTVTASDPQGCTAQTSATVNVKSSLTLTVSDDLTLCQGKRTTLQASGADTYSWTTYQLTPATGPTISVAPLVTTTYYVTGTAPNLCPGKDSVTVTVHPIPVFGVTPNTADICPNDTLRLIASGGDTYAWTASDGTTPAPVPSVLVQPSDNTNYQVSIVDNICQMNATLTVPVTMKPTPDIHITSSNNIDCTLGQTTLRATGASTWTWMADSTLSPFASTAIARPSKPTIYYVLGTGANGCSTLDSVTVAVDFTTDGSSYPVPNAFTPNNDGKNDCFGLKYWGRITTLELQVFNRNGQQVFETNNPQACWDGTYRGTPQPAGAYVYQIKAATMCGTAYRKGIVILVR